MTFVHSSLLDAPVEEVFAWHGRPGAIARLTPPWQPVRVLQEAESLADGRAVLGLPGGLRWVADHVPEEYAPPYAFEDRLTSRPLAPLVRWRHRHEMTAEGAGTRLTDVVTARLPGRLLAPMFAYRHRQLAGDLATLRAHRHEPLTIAVTGSSGLVGRSLVPLLTTGGHRVVRLVRRGPRSADERRWTPDSPDADLLAGIDVVVHLAGASIAGRFDDDHKMAVRESRVGPTRRLAELAARSGVRALVSASAVGFYGTDRGDEVLTETSGRGDGFLADVVADWEADTAPAEGAGVRVVRVRTGIVQTPRGGALRLQVPLYAAGLGGRLGSGEQWQPWIGIDDLTDVYLRAVVDPALSGAVNAVAPEPVRQQEYAEVLARVLHRPAVLPTPAFGPRLLLGEDGAREVALAGQRVLPAVLDGLGHRFRHGDLEGALRHVLGR